MMNTDTYNRNGLLDVLQSGFVRVTFTKVDGSERIMECTLRPDLIPTPNHIVAPDKPKRIVKDNEEVIRVFDTEKKEWRSFRIDSVKHVVSME